MKGRKKGRGGKRQASEREGRGERALSISARLRGLPQGKMEANHALKLLFRAAQSPCRVPRGCRALCRSARREGHGTKPPCPELPPPEPAPPQGTPSPPCCSRPLGGDEGPSGSIPWTWHLGDGHSPPFGPRGGGSASSVPPTRLCPALAQGCWGLPQSKGAPAGTPPWSRRPWARGEAAHAMGQGGLRGSQRAGWGAWGGLTPWWDQRGTPCRGGGQPTQQTPRPGLSPGGSGSVGGRW